MEIIQLLANLNPLWVVVSFLSGLIIGYITSDIKIDKRTIQLLILYWTPFAVSRLIIVLLFGLTFSTGIGYVGTILVNIYIIAIIIGRKIGNRKDDD